MESGTPASLNTTTPDINAEWIYETYKQQQQTNDTILQLLQSLQGHSQPKSQSELPSQAQNKAVNPSATFRPKHVLPQPEYSHSDPSTYPQFRGLLAQKLRVDALACGDTEQDRVWYGFACLKGEASSRIFPWIDYAEKIGTQFTVQAFLEQLDIAFSDPQKVQKAMAKINQIKQGRKPFREYLQEFEQTLLEAGGWGWDDIVRKGFLKAGINYKLKSLLVSQPEPALYVEYVSLLRLTSDNLEALERSSPSYQPRTPLKSSEPMDWQPTNRVFVPKDVQSTRIANNQCLKCGRPGHIGRDCRIGWSLPRAAVAATELTPIRNQETSDSGKE
jgi:Zinc knuckle